MTTAAAAGGGKEGEKKWLGLAPDAQRVADTLPQAHELAAGDAAALALAAVHAQQVAEAVGVHHPMQSVRMQLHLCCGVTTILSLSRPKTWRMRSKSVCRKTLLRRRWAVRLRMRSTRACMRTRQLYRIDWEPHSRRLCVDSTCEMYLTLRVEESRDCFLSCARIARERIPSL